MLLQVCGAEIEGVSFCEDFTYFLSSLLFFVTYCIIWCGFECTVVRITTSIVELP